MVDMPERIWAFQSNGWQRGWLHIQPPQAIIDIPTAYVRADLFDTLTEERDRLKDQRDYYKARDEEGERIQAEIEAERDRLAKRVDELQELFRIDGENHASVVRYITNRHETRITKYAERTKELREANAELLASLASVLQACDEGRMVERGAGGMTIDAQIRRSVINGVPAWPIEEARALLDKHKATSTEREGK